MELRVASYKIAKLGNSFGKRHCLGNGIRFFPNLIWFKLWQWSARLEAQGNFIFGNRKKFNILTLLKNFYQAVGITDVLKI